MQPVFLYCAVHSSALITHSPLYFFFSSFCRQPRGSTQYSPIITKLISAVPPISLKPKKFSLSLSLNVLKKKICEFRESEDKGELPAPMSLCESRGASLPPIILCAREIPLMGTRSHPFRNVPSRNSRRRRASHSRRSQETSRARAACSSGAT